MKNAIQILILSFVVAGCAKFQGSPFTDHIESSGSQQNLRQQERLFSDLQGIVPTDQNGIKIALMSDNHHNYNDIDTVVDILNQRNDLNFVVHAGDMTDSAYNFEYDAFISKFTRLNAPAFTVIGNHDAIGKGRKIYKNYFGEYNYAFVYHGYHFIFFNNNRLEFINEGWSLDWLEAELAKNSGVPKIVIQHINYDNADAFTDEMSEKMKSLYENNGVQWVINGHRHVFGFDTINNVRYLQVPRIEDASYLVLSLQDGEFQLESYKGASNENTYQGSLSH
ncbi:MAG: metallophosphoesterase [Bdellovibrionales bacterium]|nr:metallophosphoesterase [Bdellovibrionales bacterium]